MFFRGIPLFNLFGFQIKMDPSWLFLALLLIWTLSKGFFPHSYPGLSDITYLWMGISGMLGLFGSIVLHEFGHAWVAQRFGIPMRGITLFLFGGVAEMSDDSPSPLAEFWMALAGPLVSVFILLFSILLSFLGSTQKWPVPLVAVITYLAFINGILIIFNLVPAFPLDGGRILRSLLWQWKKNLQQATRIASNYGKWFGLLLIFLGVLNAINGEFLGGVWWILIGLFLRQTADMSYQQVLFRWYLEGMPLRRFLKTDVITVPAEVSIKVLVEDYFYYHYFKGYPVIDQGQLVGYVSIQQVQHAAPSEWEKHAVREIMTPITGENTVSVEADAVHALAQMSKTGLSTLLVVENHHLVGLLALKDLLQFLSMKIALEEVK